ncbi:hypothetical protein PsYK624_168600 [Phanerochaete sordida]|uniref:Uncharacterized protein n=1 Tax=Phanerochaete sordida TaxID=48140 RepID=A0A9P3GSR2_9APHY|nr:hypothetical protein PsYK624_168600 [Phanerochaete sordida]
MSMQPAFVPASSEKQALDAAGVRQPYLSGTRTPVADEETILWDVDRVPPGERDGSFVALSVTLAVLVGVSLAAFWLLSRCPSANF